MMVTQSALEMSRNESYQSGTDAAEINAPTDECVSSHGFQYIMNQMHTRQSLH